MILPCALIWLLLTIAGYRGRTVDAFLWLAIASGFVKLLVVAVQEWRRP